MVVSSVTVLGCGWTGVLAAYFIFEKFPNVNVICIDRENKLGGLMRTKNINNFVFDVGGSHIIFSRDQQVLQEMLSFLGGNVMEHYRKAYVYLDGIYVPYPFENGIWVLPPEKRGKILVSFVEMLIDRARDPSWCPRNLREWIYGFFGKEIARLYLEPYNEKIWKRDLDEIDAGWVYTPGRLPIPDWRDVVRSGAGVATEGYREQARFYYPLKGGIQSLYNAVLGKAISRGLKIIKGMKIEKIRRIGYRWLINDCIEAKKIISTIPLNELVKALNAPEQVIKLSEQLDYNSVAVIGIALRRKAPDMHWIYVPNKNIIFHRYAWISNYSPYNTPNNNVYSSIIAELTVRPQQKINMEYIIDKSIDDLKKLHIISESEKELLFTRIWINHYGYPVHTKTSSIARAKLLNYVNELGIVTLGRWGTWRYLNMDKIYAEVRDYIQCLKL